MGLWQKLQAQFKYIANKIVQPISVPRIAPSTAYRTDIET
jgi:hypothetical protein